MSIVYSGDKITFADGSTLGSGWAGFKNRIINGAMMIDQRNAGASVTISSDVYTLDRWRAYQSQTGKFSVQQNAGSVTPPTGFKNYLGVTSLSSYSVTSGDYFLINQMIEGNNIADLGFGTSTASTVTISFWVRSSLTGTFGGAIINNNFNRTYPFTYTISAANTWEQKSVTITGDTIGTWENGTGNGMSVRFVLGCGSARLSSSINQWVAGGYDGPTGSTSVVGTNGATFYITGVQLEKGSTATSFDYRPYTTELQLCQRYFVRFGGTAAYTPFGSGMWRNSTTPNVIIPLPVQMRTSPTCNFTSPSYFYVSGGGTNVTPSSIALDQSSPLSLMVDAPYSSGGTSGQGTRLFAANSTSAVIDTSAEL